jgi:5-methylcytosine-specific restriction enzyme subunit McrC
MEPRAIPIRNVWYMLLYAWDQWEEKRAWESIATEASPGLLGLLARVLVASSDDLLRHQLARAHRQEAAEVAGVRGKLDFAASLKRLSFQRGRAVCRYPELSVDTLKNRILRSTMHRLATDGRLVFGASEESFRGLRHDLRTAVRRMEGVAIAPVSKADFSRLVLGRSDRAYRVPLAVCELIARMQMPTETDGDVLMAALLQDEDELHRIFEAFLRNLLRFHLPKDTHEVVSEHLDWPCEGSPLMPRMETDITIWERRPVTRRLVIDAKCYRAALTTNRFGAQKYRRDHLFQLYAYLRTQEERGPGYTDARGMLVYPAVDVRLDERLMIQGHEIRIVSVDLDKDWADIERQVLSWVERPAVPSAVGGQPQCSR